MTTSRKAMSVTIVLTMDDGSTCERTYVRGNMRLSENDFVSFALGDLLCLTGYRPVSWTIATN